MTFCYKIGSQEHTLSGFGTQQVWDGAGINILPNGTTDVWLVVLGSVSLDVDFRYFDNSTDAGSMGHVSINPSLTLCDGSSVRGWHHTYDRTLHNSLQVDRVTPVAGTWTFELWVSGTGTPGYCEWGTEMLPGQQAVLTLSAGAFELAALAFPPLQPFAIAFGALVGVNWAVHIACSGPPPDFPVFTEADWVIQNAVPTPGGVSKLLQFWEAAVWGLYCRCVAAPPGSLDPAPPPAMVALPPGTELPALPEPILCDANDICATLNVITRHLISLSGQVQLIRRDVQLVQRQQVPFAYLPGDLHTGLTGAGTFAVQGILGLSIDTTAKPAYLSSDMAPVASWFKLGEVSWGTADGWMARRIVTHDPHLFLDIPADITAVAYQFELGVTANILELVREA